MVRRVCRPRWPCPRALAWLACAGLLLAACGGASSSSHTTSKPSSTVVWASSTQQLCREKQAAISNLGGVHITYAGIARVGLPAVKRSLEGYLDRLLAVLREFSERQHRLATPPAFVSTMKAAAETDAESEAATSRLRASVARLTSAAQLSAAFRAWATTLSQLSARGDAEAARLKLPACRA